MADLNRGFCVGSDGEPPARLLLVDLLRFISSNIMMASLCVFALCLQQVFSINKVTIATVVKKATLRVIDKTLIPDVVYGLSIGHNG